MEIGGGSGVRLEVGQGVAARRTGYKGAVGVLGVLLQQRIKDVVSDANTDGRSAEEGQHTLSKSHCEGDTLSLRVGSS